MSDCPKNVFALNVKNQNIDFNNMTSSKEVTLENLADIIAEQQDYIDSILSRLAALEAKLKGG